MAQGYVAHKKQSAAHRAFMQDGYKRGVLMWGRQCLHPDTLVRTQAGLICIAEIIKGDEVLSFGKDWEYKKVTGVTEYGVDLDPKPMLYFKLYGQYINCTYDHPFYYGGYYIPIYQLIWGEMATSQREKLELLCKQYGATFDDPSLWRLPDSSDEASPRQQRVSENDGRRPHDKDAPLSSPNLDTEPRQQARSEPYRRQPSKQSSEQSGVGDAPREHPTHSQDGESVQSTRGELRVTQAQRVPGTRNTSYEKHDYATDGKEVRGFKVYNPRYTGQDELAAHIEVTEATVTYSIEVEDNHNYCITDSDILVANSGKTYFSTQHAWISAVKDQGRYFVVFKTYKQAHEVVWRQYVPLIPKELIFKKNEQDLLIELNYIENTPMTLPDGETIIINHDTTKPRSTIQLLGSDQADSHRGFRANGMIFDEYADQSPDNWDSVYKHFFTTTDGWSIFMGTPRGYNHFYDLVEYAKINTREEHEERRSNGELIKEKPWFYQEATWRDSPFVKKEFIEQERAEATKKGTLSTFLQEVELEFRAVQGAVYPDFDRKIHVVKPGEVPVDGLTYYGAIDFGWHTTAFLLWGVDKDQNWYLVDEVYGKEETLENLIPRIKNCIGDKRVVLIVADSANRDAIEVMNKSFPVAGVNKANDTKGYQLGISLITEKLKPRQQLIGLPKPTMFIASNCKNFIFELESYRFPEDKKDRNPSDVPIKENDHGPDAARYLFLHLKHGMQKEEKLPEPWLKKNTNEYNLL